MKNFIIAFLIAALYVSFVASQGVVERTSALCLNMLEEATSPDFQLKRIGTVRVNGMRDFSYYVGEDVQGTSYVLIGDDWIPQSDFFKVKPIAN